MRLRFALWMVVPALAVAALPALGHHGWGGNATEEFEISAGRLIGYW
jgi:hypothetical protein